MAKRKLLQWMRERLNSHAEKVVAPAVEKKALDVAYKKADALARAAIQKKYPPADMKVLEKYKATDRAYSIQFQFPNGVVNQFNFEVADLPVKPTSAPYNEMFLADAATAAAVEKWATARDAYSAERKKRLDAYRALILCASYVEDIVEMWPETASILPAGSPLIPLGPEQIALVKADLRERKAA